MKLIGVTDKLGHEAERQCAAEFRAWLMEAQTGTWGNWEELLKQYPLLSRLDEEHAHIPLRADGTGICVRPFFDLQLMLLHRIDKMPVRTRLRHGSRFPATRNQHMNHAKI